MDEAWKDIKGYEGLYQVSDKGRGVYRLTIDRKEIGNFKTLAQAAQKRKELLNA